MAAKKQIARGIKILISWYEWRRAHNNLCTVGKERLTWWKKEGVKFPSVAAAMKGWTDQQVRAFVDDRGRQLARHLWTPGGGSELSRQAPISVRVENPEKLSKKAQAALKIVQEEALKHRSPWRAKFDTLKDDVLIPDIWVPEA